MGGTHGGRQGAVGGTHTPQSLMPQRFVSYAQNFEDVMLWRALKHIDRGFYFDVGAYSPLEDSVTQAFYERGWRGINVEPYPPFHREFVIARPRDINLQIAAGEQTSNQTLFVIQRTGLSTLDQAQANERRKEGHSVLEQTVRVESLASLWAAYVAPLQPVHFLKIDVEGFEGQVLAGNDWAANRPWIVVVESTLPQTMSPSHEAWEAILTGAGYALVYGDGLNRFYVASERAELAAAFEFPPNVFDDFVRMGEVRAAERASVAEARAARAEMEIDALRSSRSWRMTAPMRAATGTARSLRLAIGRKYQEVRRASRAGASRLIPKMLRYANDRSVLRLSRPILKRIPGLASVYRRFEAATGRTDFARYRESDLSPRAQQVYHALRSPYKHPPE